MLTQLISNQTSSLQILNLNSNYFSEVNTEKLLSRIAECGVCSTLKELNLWESANLDSDESLRKLAKIFATAPVLKSCNIYSSFSRMIGIKVQYATEGSMGTIAINKRVLKPGNYEDWKNITRRETDKQEAYHKMQILYNDRR